MVASRDTIKQVYDAVRMYVLTEQMESIVGALQKIEGNKSFRDTIDGIAKLYLADERRRRATNNMIHRANAYEPWVTDHADRDKGVRCGDGVSAAGISADRLGRWGGRRSPDQRRAEVPDEVEESDDAENAEETSPSGAPRGAPGRRADRAGPRRRPYSTVGL